ncbi:DNA/RNA non-specific endonuclease [Ralstonia pseudosolanacearum]|uniref:DNA/RNA non-specific endonuclease n=1 Tax=Ralstonia pseudosolanacearum TaxID=1310165 RepID=UPI003CF043A5
MLKKTLLFVVLSACLQIASASADLCDASFADRTQPKVLATKQASAGHLVCYRAYAVFVSSKTRTPLWSAEHLTAQAVNQARELTRDSQFYEELALPAGARATLADFRGSGYDRGHMSPSGDFGDKTSQQESFSLANVVPQDPTSNRRMWSHLETSTRRLVRQTGEAFVVTGPAFTQRDDRYINGRVRVPDYLWKAIFVPGVGAAAYVAPNDATPRYAVISIAELAQFAGVDAFPDLPAATRNQAMDLPPPTPHPHEKAGRQTTLNDLLSRAPAGEGEDVEPTAVARLPNVWRLARAIGAAVR